MANVSKKIQKMISSGLNLYEDRSSFRHYKSCQKSWKGESRNAYQKMNLSEKATIAANEIVENLPLTGIPVTRDEFEEQCRTAFNTVGYLPIQAVIEQLPAEFRVYVKTLTDSTLSEPLFVKSLSEKDRKKALSVLNCIPMESKPEAVSLLDEYVKEGMSVDSFMKAVFVDDKKVCAANQYIRTM